MKTIELLIADDHPIFRKSLVRLVSLFDRNFKFFEAGNGLEVLQIIEKEKIDLILLDIQMPKMNGIDCLKEVKILSPNTKVIVLTQFDEPSLIVLLAQLGAEGFLLKECDPKELETAIDAVLTIGYYYNNVAEVAIKNYNQKKGSPIANLDLTSREMDIAKLLVKGLSSEKIGEQLSLSALTINSYRKSILKKTGCSNTAALTRLLLLSGIFYRI
ncbi:MAG: response regulator transcription factor [Bacteroidetes bacterium]|nr:response regulator transcription factor [Bacteroidota bacterium]